MLVSLILAGGVGSRLWPLSRDDRPKQFIDIAGMECLFVQSLKRAELVSDKIVIITNYQYRFHVQSCIDSIASKVETVCFYEEEGKNSAPAIIIACQWLKNKHNDCEVLVMTADHKIDNIDAFKHDIVQASQLAKENKLVSFGINPTDAHVGYGYLDVEGSQVKRFIEKPNKATAKSYIENGYLWNSGMFYFTLETFTREIQKHCKELSEQLNQIKWQTQAEGYILPRYGGIQNISIDYALFEKSSEVACVKASFKWCDVGSWESLFGIGESDDNGNINQANCTLFNSKNNLIYGGKDKAIALIGVENLLIIDMLDALLICNREDSQSVKDMVEKLREIHSSVVTESLESFRPWGGFKVLAEGNNYKVKELRVLQKRSLSLQSHKLRSEHWVVISGIATVTKDDSVTDLSSNESIFIPVGCKHRLQNRTKNEELIVIEVQTGNYLGEDDITRYQDEYNRMKRE